CSLDLNLHPYQPLGNCLGPEENIKAWGGISTTLCCQNALTALSKALALHANTTNQTIFLRKESWKNCIGPITSQSSASASSCGFDYLVSNTSDCSNLTLTSINHYVWFQKVSSKCLNFGDSLFKNACNDCINDFKDASYHLLNDIELHKGKNDKAICAVALVTAIAAQRIYDKPSVDNFYTCLHALDEFEPGYIRIKSSMAKAVLAILIATTGLMLVIMLVKYVTKNKAPRPARAKQITTWSGLYRFSKAEIENAINYGNERISLGRGSAGQVYKGILPSGQIVAIKHIYKSNTSDSFSREVEGLSRVRHPNLVCLFGCCVEGGDQYLVYEYCSAGNLSQHLLRKDTALTWERRVKILRDCALALRYLHRYIDGCIVHRDIKARDVNTGKRPLKDFEDPRLNGNLNIEDFESILKIAVLCVAKSSKGRPSIDVVVEELDKAWKNTMANLVKSRTFFYWITVVLISLVVNSNFS
ncbi:SPARK domain, partial [Dillenia turbinata]